MANPFRGAWRGNGNGRMGWAARSLGNVLDFLTPYGDQFNPNSSSFGEGWLNSQWGNALRDARSGDYQGITNIALTNALTAGLGGYAQDLGLMNPVTGNLIGRASNSVASSITDSLWGNSPSDRAAVANIARSTPVFNANYSAYGPYASGYNMPDDYGQQQPNIMDSLGPFYEGPYAPSHYGLANPAPATQSVFGMGNTMNNSGWGTSAMGTTYGGVPLSAMASIRGVGSMSPKKGERGQIMNKQQV